MAPSQARSISNTDNMQHNLKVLLVDLSVRFGGTNARVLGQLSILSPDSAAVAVLNNSPLHQKAQARGYEVHPVGPDKADWRIIQRLNAIIRQGGFEVIDTHNIQSAFWGSFVAQRSNVANVSTLNSWYFSEHQRNLKGRIYQMLERYTRRNVDLYIAVSNEIRNNLQQDGVPESKIELIPNAIQIDPEKITVDEQWLMDTFEIPAGSWIVLAVGRLVAAKGYRYLIESIRILKGQYPNIHCLIIGDGELRPALEEQIQQTGTADRVHLSGFLEHDNVLSAIKLSDVFAMPSITEGTPIALLEAAALARPIVASQVGGVPTIVSHRQEALLVPPGDPVALADALVDLYSDQVVATQLGKQARQRILRDFSLQSQVQDMQRAWLKAYRTKAARTTGTTA